MSSLFIFSQVFLIFPTFNFAKFPILKILKHDTTQYTLSIVYMTVGHLQVQQWDLLHQHHNPNIFFIFLFQLNSPPWGSWQPLEYPHSPGPAPRTPRSRRFEPASPQTPTTHMSTFSPAASPFGPSYCCDARRRVQVWRSGCNDPPPPGGGGEKKAGKIIFM